MLKYSLTINNVDKFEEVRKAPDFKGSCDTLSSLDSNNINNR